MGDEITTNPDKSVNMAASTASGAAAGTAIMPGWGTAIGAGVGLIGGALSNYSNQNQADKGYATQKEALQNSIRWRVADAKAAGIHPLYALGAPAFNVSPVTYEDKIGPAIQQMGQMMPDITRGKISEPERILQFEQYRNLVSQTDKNDAEAGYWRSMGAKVLSDTRSVNTTPGLGVQNEMGQDPKGAGQGLQSGWYENKAAEQISGKYGKPWSSAGKNPAYQLRMMDDGLPMYLPIAEGDSAEETIDEMSMPTWGGLLLRNARIFGPGWMKDMVNSRYLGIKPEHRYEVNKDYSTRTWPRNAIGQKYNPAHK